MLTEERPQVNLSFSIKLDLMKSQLRQSGKPLHQQICKQLNGYHAIDPISGSKADPMYLKIILQASPELFYGVMLLPDREDLTSSELSAQRDYTLALGDILEEQEDDLSESWIFCCFSGNLDPFASPKVILQFYVLLMSGKLSLFAIYSEDIIALGMNQYLIKSFSFEHLSKILRAIPTIESDRKLCNIDPFVFEKLYHPFDHIPEYLWLGCVGSALFANRPYRKRDDPITYLDGYGDDVLAFDNLFVSSTIPAVGQAYNLAQPIYDRIVNTDCDPLSGKSRRAFTDDLPYQLYRFMTSHKEEHSPELKDAPGIDRSINFVLVYLECISQLIRREYLEDVTACQHQKYLYPFLIVLSELSVEKYLKCLERFDNFILHFGSPYMGYFSIFIRPPIRRPYFFLFVNNFRLFYLLLGILSQLSKGKHKNLPKSNR